MGKDILQLYWQFEEKGPASSEFDVVLNAGVYRHFTNLPLKMLGITAETFAVSVDELLMLGFAVLLHHYFNHHEILISVMKNHIPIKNVHYYFSDQMQLIDLIDDAQCLKYHIDRTNPQCGFLNFEIKTIKQKNLLSLYYRGHLATEDIQENIAGDYKKTLQLLVKYARHLKSDIKYEES